MAEPFKLLISPELIHRVAEHLARLYPAFPQQDFVARALKGLDAQPLKGRMLHVADALQACLPPDFHAAADILEASLKPVPPVAANHDPDKDLWQLQTNDDGIGGWAVWSYGEVVVRMGMTHPARALQALHAFTQRFTAEFAIRPFIIAHPDLVWRTLQVWQHDASAHVRRLVSEGSRPRLPWGLRLQALVQDPSPTLPLLRHLQNDPSEYVRRSVANHLNDIAKDHPALLTQWLHAHLPAARPEQRRLLRHASRHLIKQGHTDILHAWGIGHPFDGTATLALSATTASIGGHITLTATLHAQGTTPQALELDYRVHHQKANGQTSPKTFKGKRLTMPPASSLQWDKAHSLRPVSTRRYHPGTHRVELLLNGQVVAEATFELT